MLNLLRLVTQKPQLLLAHADAYSELVGQEIAQASNTWRCRLLFGASALLLLSMAGVLAGVAGMLWAVVPAAQIHSPWLLWFIPLIPLALAAICLQRVKSYARRSVFFDLRMQIATDASLLREMSAAA
jgi:hypothetical protein